MSRAATHPSLLARPGPKLGRYLTASVVGHVVLVVAVIIYTRFGSDRSLVDLDQKPIRATLVRKGKPRDEKLLPRKEELPAPPQKSEEAPAPAEPAPKPPPEKPTVAVPIPDLKPVEKKSEKRAGEKTGVDRKKQLFSAFDKASKKVDPEELEGAADGDEHGDSATQEGDRYWGLLTAQVKRHYDIPQTISEDERIRLLAQVQIRVARDGALMDARIVKSSGNELFDNAVLAALKRAQPFSPPPEHLREILRRGQALEFVP